MHPNKETLAVLQDLLDRARTQAPDGRGLTDSLSAILLVYKGWLNGMCDLDGEPARERFGRGFTCAIYECHKLGLANMADQLTALKSEICGE